ncbi:MAG: cyclase family protein [Burkholderiaceae bacterium]
MTRRWKHRPEGSTWGDWGDDDQLGRLNLLTPRKVLEGIAEVREGIAFSLSLPLDFPGGNVVNPRRFPPVLSPTVEEGCICFNFPMSRKDPANDDVLSDDKVVLHTQYSTQWDSFAHVGAYFDADGDGEPEAVYYNGFRANQHVTGPVEYLGAAIRERGAHHGATSLAISNMARTGVQGRGVLVDLLRTFGEGRHYVGMDGLAQAMREQDVQVEPGDMLLLRTGYTEAMVRMDRKPDIDVLNRTGCVLDGRDASLLDWITRSGVAALISDNYAVEGLPARAQEGRRPALPLHQHCLFKLGVPLGEMWWLADLAEWLHAHGRTKFLLTAPPLNLPGAVGSPVTPVATV